MVSPRKTIHYSLNGHRVDDAANFEAALLELHDRRVVDASSLREDKDRWVVRIRHVLLQSLGHQMAILGLAALKPNVGRCAGQSSLQHPQEAAMALANLESRAKLIIWLKRGLELPKNTESQNTKHA